MSAEAFAGGRYRLERALGSGGMAIVYLARDAELDRPVAIKVLAENLAGDEAFRVRFLREAQLAARLAHPNVAAVFDAGEDGTRPFIVMEYVEGETLATVLARRKTLPPAETIELGLQACAGLEHAHRAGLVHRDVKPQNLLLRADGVLKIVDFGIARAAEATRLTEIGTILGTAAYLSPEQAAGEGVTQAADIYSLGAVLYELLAGRTPVAFDSLAELAAKQREGVVEPLRDAAPDVPEELEAVVMHCLARNPEYRPASALTLAQELAAASPEPPTVPIAEAPVTPTIPLRSRGRHIQRSWRWVAAGVAALAVLAAIVVALASRGSSTPAAPGPVEPVPHAATPQQYARNYAGWIRRHSK